MTACYRVPVVGATIIDVVYRPAGGPRGRPGRKSVLRRVPTAPIITASNEVEARARVRTMYPGVETGRPEYLHGGNHFERTL